MYRKWASAESAVTAANSAIVLPGPVLASCCELESVDVVAGFGADGAEAACCPVCAFELELLLFLLFELLELEDFEVEELVPVLGFFWIDDVCCGFGAGCLVDC